MHVSAQWVHGSLLIDAFAVTDRVRDYTKSFQNPRSSSCVPTAEPELLVHHYMAVTNRQGAHYIMAACRVQAD